MVAVRVRFSSKYHTIHFALIWWIYHRQRGVSFSNPVPAPYLWTLYSYDHRGTPTFMSEPRTYARCGLGEASTERAAIRTIEQGAKTMTPPTSEAFSFSHDQALADIRRSSADSEWLNANRKELSKEHPNMLVAVFDRKVVGVAEAIDEMRALLRDRGIDPEKCVTEVMLTEDYIWVL
jgi:hypothetical protein